MTDERWRVAWDVYEEACELPAAERRNFVESHLSDPAMQQKILSLLERRDSVSSTEASEPTEDEWAHAGQTIGRFLVTVPLGRGARRPPHRLSTGPLANSIKSRASCT